MLELHVYYHDVLRYTVIANWDKVQELRNEGFYVKVKEVPRPRSGVAGMTHDHIPNITGMAFIERYH